MLLGLDLFGDNPGAGSVGEIDDGSDDGDRFGARQRSDELAGKLEHVGLEAGGHPQAGVAVADVIDGEPDARTAKLGQLGGGQIEIDVAVALGGLEDELIGFETDVLGVADGARAAERSKVPSGAMMLRNSNPAPSHGPTPLIGKLAPELIELGSQSPLVARAISSSLPMIVSPSGLEAWPRSRRSSGW